MPRIQIKVVPAEIDDPAMAPVREEIAAIARESLARVSYNQSAILADDVLRGHEVPPDGSDSGRKSS
jgi:hypothetical protein